MEFTLSVDKWDIGLVSLSLGWEGLGVERAHGFCATFPLFCCLAQEKL